MRIIFIIFIVSLGASSCGYEYKQKVESEGPTSYFAVREKIIKPQCTSCHPAFESYKVLSKFVNPGNPDGSKLYTIINEEEMPPTERKVPDARKAYLRRWIEEGAGL